MSNYNSLILRYIAQERQQRHRRLNVRMLIGTFLVLAVAAPAVFFWHQHQLHRICTALLYYADRMESEQRWEEAADVLYRYWKIRPEAEALGRLAQNYDKAEVTRDRQGVISSYQRAVGMLPHRADLRIRLSELLVQERQYGLALEQVEKVLAQHPQDKSAWKSKSLASLGAYHQGQPIAIEDVRATLEQAFRRQPNDSQLAKALAKVIRDDMQAVTGSQLARQADQIMDRLVAAAPHDAQCYLARYQYRTRYELPGASHDLTQALIFGLDNPEVVQQAAWNAHRDRDWLTARVLFKHLIELKPDSADGYIGLGDVETFSGRPEHAISIWSIGRTRSVTTLPLLLRLAEAQIQLGRLDVAQRSLHEIDQWLGSLASRGDEHQRNWATSAASLLWGRWHLAHGTPRVAVRHMHTAAILGTHDLASKHPGLKPVAYSARLLLGDTYASLGQWEDAAASFEQALQLRFDSARTLLSAADAWGRLGQLQSAVLRVSQALHQPHVSTLVLLRHAQFLFEHELCSPEDQRDWSKFESALQTARLHASDSWELRLLEADYHLQRSGPQAETQVLGILNSLEQSLPDAISLWRRLPLYYETLGLEERTDLALKRLDELTSSSAEAKILRADVLIGRGRAAQALCVLRGCDPARLSPSEQRQLDFARLRLLETDGSGDEIESRLIELTTKYTTQTQSIELLLDRRFAGNQLDGRQPSTKSLIEQLKRRQGDIQAGWQYYAARYDLDSSIDDGKRLARVDSYLRSLEHTRSYWSKTRELAGRIALRRGDVAVATRALEDAIKSPIADPQVYELLLRRYLADGNYQAIWRLLDQWVQSPPLSRQVEGYWPGVQRKLDVCRACAAMGVPRVMLSAGPHVILSAAKDLRGSWPRSATTEILRSPRLPQDDSSTPRCAADLRPQDDTTLPQDDTTLPQNDTTVDRSGDLIWLRMLLLKNGDSRQARELLEEFLQQYPNDVAAWMIQLKQDMDSHDGPQATKTLASIQALDVQPAELKPFVLGQAFQLVGLLKESRQAYRDVDRKSPFRLQAEIYVTAVANRMDSRFDNLPDEEPSNSVHGHSSNSVPQQP